MAVCWCREKNCEQIFTGKDVNDIVYSEDVVLPCGHKIAVLAMGASALREAVKAEAELERLRPRMVQIGEFYCEHCRIGDDNCEYNVLGEKCHLFRE